MTPGDGTKTTKKIVMQLKTFRINTKFTWTQTASCITLGQ